MTTLTLPAGHFTLRPIDIERDAVQLAAMWQASDDQWPGTVSDGVPMTPERAVERERREQSIQTLIWDAGDAIAGYCSFWATPEEAQVYYIATLNVAPAYQGLGLARRFLTHYVDETIRRGGIRLDLNTWSGNLKAMPLYKRCGFFWEPGSSVHMLNFMPSILALPFTRAFFERNPWYTSLQRALTQAEDDETWEGMGVYTYRFLGADGEELIVRADREACRITSVESADFAAAAIVANHKPPRGLPLPIRWRLTNRRTTPLPISLFASGSPDFILDRRETLTLAPGETRELADVVQISATLPDIERGRPKPNVRTILVIDGEVLELGTGARPGPAVEIESFPEYVTLTPGVTHTIELALHSRLDRDIPITVALNPAPGLNADWMRREITIPAGGVAGLPVELHADTAGVYNLAVTLTFPWGDQTIQPPLNNRAIFAIEPGGLLGSHDGERLRIETAALRMLIQPRGAGIEIYDRATNLRLIGEDGYAAPPVMPSEYWDARYNLRLERRDEQLVALAEYESKQNPGFILRKEAAISADGTIGLAYEFDNRGIQTRTFYLSHSVDIARDDYAVLTIPMQEGPVRGAWNTFPNVMDDRMRALECYSAHWAAVEIRGTVVGVFWGDDLASLEFNWGVHSQTREYICPPGSRVRPAPRRLLISPGNWHTIERYWRTMHNLPLQPVSRPHDPLEARFAAPILALDGATDAELQLRHYRARAAAGIVTLDLPTGWQAEPASVPFEGLTWQASLNVPLRLHSNTRPGAFAGMMTLSSPEADRHEAVTLLHLGKHSGISISEAEAAGQRILRIANGRIELDVAPEFGGVLVALREGAVNHLATPFPQITTINWLSPWHGGLTPVLRIGERGSIPGILVKQRFEAEAISSDIAGISWYGVRQRTTLTGERQYGMTIEIDTLTLGDSPLIRQTLRVINPTSASHRLHQFGWLAFVQPDGDRAATTLWNARGQQLKQSDRITWLDAGHLVAAENTATGRTLAFVSPEPLVRMSTWGIHNAHMALFDEAILPAGGQLERTGYLVLAETLEEALRYEVLRDIR